MFRYADKGRTRTKLDTEGLAGSENGVTDSNTGSLLVNLDCGSVGLDTNDLWRSAWADDDKGQRLDKGLTAD